MKLTVIIMTIVCLHVSAKALSQITIKAKNLPFAKAIVTVEEQSGYSFFFKEKLVKDIRVNLNLNKASLQDALDQIFAGQPLEYKIQDKTIVIKEKEEKPVIVTKDKELFTAPYTITGKVLDENKLPLVGVTVKIKGSNKVVLTNVKGDFYVTLNANAVLIISYIGYTSKEIAVTPISGIITVFMEPGSSKLDEIQVIAYGNTSQRYNTGSVTTVTAKEIEGQPVTNLFQTLEGRVPGLVVTSTNGAPGAMTLTQVRGQNSLASRLNATNQFSNYNQPLYIIDGVPLAVQNTPILGGALQSTSAVNPYSYLTGLSPINGINPADIESISVLKDADATSIYGSQGSNGVILITTKKGKPGTDKIDFYINSGPTTASRTTQMMNTQQYLQMRNEALTNSATTATLARDPDILLFDQDKYTDWKKQLFGGTGRRTDSHISVSGGSGTNSYLLSGGFTKETYNYPGDFFENRYAMHSAFTHRSTDNRFSLDFGTDYSYDQNNSANGNVNFFTGFALAPNFPDLVDANGNFLWNYKGYTYPNNPLAYTKQPGNAATFTLNTHVALKYQILSSLSFGVNAGYGRLTERYYAAAPAFTQNPANAPTGNALFANQNNDVINIEPQLNYTKKIGPGILSVLLGGTYKKTTQDGASTSVNNYTTDALLTSIAGGTITNASNSASYYKYAGGFARINYIWDSKYIFNFTGNRNGSSNFGPGRQFGSFGSAGAGWIITGEKLVQKAVPFLSFAKLSFNYGTTGSDGIAAYQYQANWRVASGVGYQGVRGINPANPLNPDYAWSLNQKFNESLDLAFFKDRLYLNLTFYQNKSSDQLVNYLEPIQIGFGSITANAPYVVQNNGIEFSLSSKNIHSRNFHWETTLNLSHNSNVLSSFPNIIGSPYANFYIVGQSVFAKALVPFNGVNPQTGIYQFTTKNPLVINSASAYNNGTGDATEIVDLNPKLTGGFGNTFSYKGLSLSVFFQFSIQKGQNYLYSIYSNNAIGLAGKPLVNLPAAMLNNWKQPGDNASIQGFFETSSPNPGLSPFAAAAGFTNSTGAYTDASYIRLKNVALSYHLSAPPALKGYIKGYTFYVNAQNLLLITGYKVGDPETQTLYAIPPQRAFVAGLNVNF